MIKKETYSDQIYEQIRKDILNQRIRLGQKLINRQLQERYGVSSTPIRDAINRLYQDGFLVSITRSGAKVVDFDCDYALEHNEIISLLSNHAVKMSAERSNIDEVSADLKRQIMLQKQYLDTEDYFTYDNEFHLTFFRSCKNKSFCDLYERYNLRQELLIRYIYMSNGKQKSLAIAQHERIYEAYRKGDIEQAQALMENHYRTAVTDIQKGFPALISQSGHETKIPP